MTIPENGDLEFKVKELSNRKPVVHLDEGESALYVGSGGDLQKVAHMLGFVDAPHYILSDFEFERKRRLHFEDCDVTETNEDGYGLVASDPSIKFVMIDQAAKGNFLEAYNNMQPGTVIYVHTISSFHPWTFRTFKERIGASAFGPSNRFLRKERDASEEDFEIANSVYKILMSPVHEVPFIQETEAPEVLVKRIKVAFYAKLSDKLGMGIAQATANVLLCAPKSKYRVEQSGMDIDTFLARINAPPQEVPKSRYNVELILQDTRELVGKVKELLPKLSSTERTAIKIRLQTTYEDLNRRSDVTYHQEMKKTISSCIRLM